MNFGRLTVIEREFLKDKKGVYWKCKCKCGNEKTVKSLLLTTNKTRSCGCLKKESRFEDLVGQKFNLLTVVKYSGKSSDNHTKWICKCECGEKTEVKSTDLKCNKQKSCGCLKRKYPKNLIGLIFDKLTVINPSQTRNGRSRFWNCLCECGNEVEVSREDLTSANKTSCGCKSTGKTIIPISGKRFNRLTVEGHCGRSKDGKILFRCICDCGNVVLATKSDFVYGKQTSCGCARKETGEDHHNWKHDKTDEERIYERSYKEYSTWRLKVFKRDNFKCFVCENGNKELNAHHIFSYAHYKNLRLSVPNGITLCKDCHEKFHKIFGVIKGNDLGQFLDFMRLHFDPIKCYEGVNDLQNESANLKQEVTEQKNNFIKYANDNYSHIQGIINKFKYIYMRGGK